ncbi:MAG: ATP-dependent RNA helicase DbpA [Chroococcidiopsis sp. SAG 2025]|uniref:DEAD/DEAH box helicase n=1 Tax=Chroococcidiopsis sp. SAG 2025 TaxID=171389 RepID=UPI002936EC8C|nr:DEAD/DEAH box helicase [Chroococcidiopsis sp. SAG 2025]MDV2996630.1 ATP-dependent RNA helicase DbpA [Chroococcidiopsis sp. SAG 2025]
MSHYLDPIDVANQPRENLIRYLLTAYPLRDVHLRYGFKRLLEEPGAIAQYPYLEGAQPYKTGSNIQQLVDRAVLHPEMARMFNPTRPLYKHQEDAIHAVVEQQENIVVATGTGSGKTECFLIPMMDYLLKHPEAGVQALILYPMNALVNDQVKRLRQLLCQQGEDRALIRFGFYTSRTETDPQNAREALKAELTASDRQELLQLFTDEQRRALNLSRPEYLVNAAMEQVLRVQVMSRQEIWETPPQILVTNYSMLEHMLIRPKERNDIFARAQHFKLLVVDEAHSYNGSTGTEVSMLIERFKSAVGIEESGQMQGIATSATLGDRNDANVVSQVIDFARDLFSEPFNRVIWGDRVSVDERLGSPYELPEGLAESEIYEYFYDLQLPSLNDSIQQWQEQLSYLVPHQILENAASQAKGNTHHFLWLALKKHPTIHRLIECLSKSPQPWHQLARSPQLWEIPRALDGTISPEEDAKLETALSHLVQLGTLARRNPDELPLLPVRLHLLFRSIEGLYACINPSCQEATLDPGLSNRPNRYGKLYLSSKTDCDCCGAPVIELSSCRKCGQAYGLTYLGNGNELQLLPRSLEAVENSSAIYVLTAGMLDSVTNDEGDDSEEVDDAEQWTATNLGTFTIHKGSGNGWLGKKSGNPPNTLSIESSSDWTLHWHRPPKAQNLQGGYLNQCPACGARRSQSPAIGRFVSYTDAPLEVMLDSLFELLPEPEPAPSQYTRRKLLTFSDGRQDAAFFASDFQRTHTETLYRQLVWQAFVNAQDNGITSVNQVEEKLVEKFLDISIPHPDREADKHHRSYVSNDANEGSSLNAIDCKKRAQSRAKELLIREFGLPSSRRFSIEALGLLACHVEDFTPTFLAQVTEQIGLNTSEDYTEARIFLTGLTDIIRLMGAIDLQGSSRYFPETGGMEGGQPARLDAKGRSQTYLKLRRESKDKQAVSFLWRKNAKGEPMQRQNQIVTYYRNFLTRFPSEESLVWLFDELLRHGILVKYNDGRQLHWELLNLRLSSQDWYQCNTCQQIFHVPGLSTVAGEAALGVDRCLAPNCDGILQPFDSNRLADHHYRHLIRERKVLPLRSQEHTAQLGTEELASRENRFRQGKINLLSCSTTLEMGVDIGELQAVALRNFPPHVSNYQQRAGRAGRRTDGVAITLMYGQRRPHDRYYFEQPTQLIDGRNQVPKLDPTNFEIQKRHIRAELLAEFLRTEYGRGAENVMMADFLGLPNTFSKVYKISAESILLKFIEWLHGQQAKTCTQQWLNRLNSKQPVEFVLQQFETNLQAFQVEQLQDWNGLSELLQSLKQAVCDAEDANDSKKQKALEYKRDRIREELEKIQKRQLHEELAKASILPIYGFPIDVVQLLTRDSKQFFQGQGKHRLQRDRRLALGEYAPGQEVVVDDRVHISVGILRPDDLPNRFYWVCQSCNFFMAASTDTELLARLGMADGDPKCPVCQAKPSTNEQKPRSYKIPKAFITDWGEQPKVTPYSKPMRQPTSQVFLAQEGDRSESQSTEFFELIVSQGGQFFLSNQGPLEEGRGLKNRGFAICKRCGRDLSEEVRRNQRSRDRQQKTSKNNSRQISHTHPITGSLCEGWYEHTHLGHEFRSDLLKIRFTSAANPPKLFGSVIYLDGGREIHSNAGLNIDDTNTSSNGAAFWRSLTYALLAAAAQAIDVPRSELDGLFRPLEESNAETAEIVIYDNVPGGAGYSKRIANHFSEILQRAYQLVESCSCSSSCYDCLRTYTNQVFHHELDRHFVSNFLSPIVERLQPDELLQSFAPDANRISLTRMASELDRYCTMAGANSIGYLPSISQPFTLQRLTQIVEALGRSSPLELMVTHLPEQASDDRVRVIRKRLSQWIDQGFLKLYVTRAIQCSILCLSSQLPHRIALQLQTSNNGDPIGWFQTRSERGVNHVFQNLQQLKSDATIVKAATLEDSDTAVIFPTPNWESLTIEQLREELGLTQIFQGNQVKKLVYSDRYLNHQKQPKAETLASLLNGNWLDNDSRIVIQIQQSKEEYDRRDTERRTDIERSLSSLPGQLKVEMRPYPKHHQPPFPHRRKLTICLRSNSTYRILFDKGLDFLKKDSNAMYCIEEATYVVVIKLPRS